MYSAVNKLSRGKRDRNPHGSAALNVNSNPSHASGSGGGSKVHEVTSKRSEVNRAGGINYLKMCEATALVREE
jgi:hypothetical protein